VFNPFKISRFILTRVYVIHASCFIILAIKIVSMLKNSYLLIVFFIFNSVFAQNSSCFEVARKGSLSEVQSLFEKDKSIVNAIDNNGSSMLILACYRGNIEVAKFLMNHNADLNYNSKNGTALMACVFKGEFQLVDELISKKANLDLTDGNGMTALMLAVQFANVEMVKKLVSAGANKTLKCKQEKTAFEYAVFSGNEQIINVLK
jgi:ankyrin repeat protein